MFKIQEKMSFNFFSNPFTSFFTIKKQTLHYLMNVFVYFLLIGLISK